MFYRLNRRGPFPRILKCPKSGLLSHYYKNPKCYYCGHDGEFKKFKRGPEFDVVSVDEAKDMI